jgi:transcriptional regulator
VTATDGPPQASHLPFLLDQDRGPKGTLLAHMARANPQWREFRRLTERGGEALVAFQGPHAYVSPTWYGPGEAVPTWNYVAVHAYGTPRVIDDPPEVRGLLERLVRQQESGFEAPWSLERAEEAYITRMLRGIVAFQIPIARLEAKAKLNQNRTPDQRRGAAAALESGTGVFDRQVAALMRKPAPGK